MYRYAVLILSGFICLAGDGLAQVSADKELLAATQKIRAVDNHSHVYVDFSAQPFLRSTREVSEMLREWLEFYPQKILFGTDAYSEDTPLANWEEKAWLTTRTTRESLAVALTRMMEEGQITRARAEELARLVLRENAFALYGLSKR